MSTLYQIILVALATAFIILFLNKTEWRYELRDWFDSKHISLIAKMLDCDFCLCFWISVFLTTFIATKDPSLIFTPFYSTPIARYLL